MNKRSPHPLFCVCKVKLNCGSRNTQVGTQEEEPQSLAKQQLEHQSERDEMNAPKAPVRPSLPSKRMSDATTPLDDGLHAYRAHFSCTYLGKVQAKSKRLITWYVVFSLWKSLPLHFNVFLA
jgi:hypothetical protein